jgi:hypothetical protein
MFCKHIQRYIAGTPALSTLSIITDIIKEDITYHGIARGGSINGGNAVPVMNTDDRFRHFFLETTNQTQLSAFLSQSACNILSPFPIGLSTSIGLIVANPAFSGDMSFANSFSRTEYHGTVVWSWQLAMMGAGLAKQLKRCTSKKNGSSGILRR